MITCDYIPVPEKAVEELLRFARVKKGEVIYDLGCGTGEFLIPAAEKLGARGVGIEVSRRLAEWAAEKVKEHGLEGRVTIIRDNFFSPQYWAHLGGGEKPYAFRNADVVAYYLTLYIQEQLRPKLEKELRPGARVVSYAFKLMPWKPVKMEKLKREDAEVPIYVFEKGKSF